MGNNTDSSVAWNGTVLMISDIKINMSWWLILELIKSTIYLAEVIVGWQLVGIINKFLTNKPPGEQRLIDIFHRITFQWIRISSTFIFIHQLLIGLFIDTGYVIAVILMWPVYNTAAICTIAIGLNPLAQLILFMSGTGAFWISYKWVYRLINMMLVLTFATISTVCSPLGYYPPAYYLMRGQEVKYNGFKVAFVIGFVVYVVTALINHFQSRIVIAENAIQKSQSLRLKTIAGSLLIIILAVIFDKHVSVMVIVSFFLLVLLPTLVIATNENLLKTTETKHPNFASFAVKMRQVFYKNSQVDPEPENSKPKTLRPETPKVLIRTPNIRFIRSHSWPSPNPNPNPQTLPKSKSLNDFVLTNC